MSFLETFFILLSAGIVGSLFGSFANVVAIRAHENSALTGRSKCMYCKKVLHPRHLVPVFSWLVQRGKCAMCAKPISIQYPIIEFLAALLAVIAVSRHLADGAWFIAGFEFFFAMALLVFLIMDWRWMELPLELMVASGIIFSLWHMIILSISGENTLTILWSHAVGLGLIASFFLFQYIVSRGRWIGAGDIWLGGMLGAVLGWPLAGIAIYFAYVFGGAVALVLLLAKQIRPGARMPFAPALIAGAIIALWWGPNVLSWLSHAIS